MKTLSDLDRMDRVTLRAWRTANLVGWWFVGAVVFWAIALLLSRTFAQRIVYTNVGWRGQVAVLLSFSFAAATAGAIAGAHVHRAPGVVGALIVLFPWALLLLLVLTAGAWIEFVVVGIMVAVPAAISATAAKIAWRRRPRALRSTG